MRISVIRFLGGMRLTEGSEDFVIFEVCGDVLGFVRTTSFDSNRILFRASQDDGVA